MRNLCTNLESYLNNPLHCKVLLNNCCKMCLYICACVCMCKYLYKCYTNCSLPFLYVEKTSKTILQVVG